MSWARGAPLGHGRCLRVMLPIRILPVGRLAGDDSIFSLCLTKS